MKKYIIYIFLLISILLLFVGINYEAYILKIEKTEHKEGEYVIDKPSKNIVLKKDVDIYSIDDTLKSIGKLYEGTTIYYDNNSNKNIFRIYGWIWENSIIRNNDLIELKVDENIRYRANSIKIGRLLKGNKLSYKANNEKGSWTLFELDFQFKNEDLPKNYDNSQKTLFDNLKVEKKIISITTKDGGERTTVNIFSSILAELTWFAFMVTFMLIFFTLIPKSKSEDVRKEVFMEIIKSAFKILITIIIAYLIFVFGLK